MYLSHNAPVPHLTMLHFVTEMCTCQLHCGICEIGLFVGGLDKTFPRHLALTLWGRDKIAAISQTTFLNAFSWMEMYEFLLRFHWSLFPRFKLTILQHWFQWWLGADQATSHYLNQWWFVYWRIYVPLGLNELTRKPWESNRIYCLLSSNWLLKPANSCADKKYLQIRAHSTSY